MRSRGGRPRTAVGPCWVSGESVREARWTVPTLGPTRVHVGPAIPPPVACAGGQKQNGKIGKSAHHHRIKRGPTKKQKRRGNAIMWVKRAKTPCDPRAPWAMPVGWVEFGIGETRKPGSASACPSARKKHGLSPPCPATWVVKESVCPSKSAGPDPRGTGCRPRYCCPPCAKPPLPPQWRPGRHGDGSAARCARPWAGSEAGLRDGVRNDC